MSDEHIEKLEKTLENFGDFLEEKIGESLVEHKDKAVGKTLANFGDFLEEKIGEYLVEHKAVWNTLANFGEFLEEIGEFLAEHKEIIVVALVVVGTSLLVGFLDGWETVLMMIGGSIVPAIFAGLESRSIKEFFKWWGGVYCVSFGGFILVKFGLLPSEY
jgi:hypothetical protein